MKQMWIVDTHRMIVPNDDDGRTFVNNMKSLMTCTIKETTTALTVETIEIRQIFYAEKPKMKGGTK